MSNVTDMNNIFREAFAFNQSKCDDRYDIHVSKCKTLQLRYCMLGDVSFQSATETTTALNSKKNSTCSYVHNLHRSINYHGVSMDDTKLQRPLRWTRPLIHRQENGLFRPLKNQRIKEKNKFGPYQCDGINGCDRSVAPP
jgi:competence CoiA-like predicted nuclease